MPALQGHPRHLHHQCLGAVCLQLDRALALARARGGGGGVNPGGRGVRTALRPAGLGGRGGAGGGGPGGGD
ncbi:hypothetical protein OFL61_29030, partial [Pseudomonas aeruginosa]|nr:hypothetical protein [Pseudomonas aeruginosa]